MISSDRFQRQTELVPRSALDQLSVSVIGVGAIGRQVALQLAALGTPRLILIDFDVVELTNVTTQGYLHPDVGTPKVVDTARAIERIDPRIRVQSVEDRFRPQLAVADAVFCCVDSITARATIWRSCQRRCQFWCDGRMLGESMRILTATEPDGRDHYPTTLFQQSEAHVGTCRGIAVPARGRAGSNPSGPPPSDCRPATARRP